MHVSSQVQGRQSSTDIYLDTIVDTHFVVVGGGAGVGASSDYVIKCRQ